MEVLMQIDWKAFLFGEEDWTFLLETIFRSAIMFIFILFGLRFLGKRGVTQLSVFELGVIIGLGSAAGDPMFYKDVGLLVGMTVLLIVLGLYKLVTFLINRSDRFERMMEGKATTVLTDGVLKIHEFKREPIAHDELFSQLRTRGVSHLGQVRQAIIETDGEISSFYFADQEVIYGLPILPQYYENKLKTIEAEGIYSCTNCGNTEQMIPSQEVICRLCNRTEWIQSINTRRIT